MMRTTLQTVFCLCLSPLLVAQQTQPIAPQSKDDSPQSSAAADASTPNAVTVPASVNIPQNTEIKLMALEDVSSEAAKKGSFVQFAVANDMVVNGVTVLRAGAPVGGTVTKVKRGVPGHHDGRLSIRIREIRIGSAAKLPLTSSDPKTRQASGRRVKDTLEGYGMCALGLPLCMILIAAFREGSPSGKQAFLPQCHAVEYWVRTTTTVSASDLSSSPVRSAVPSAKGCLPIFDALAKTQASSYLEGVEFE
jgi:hypothetical protein